MKINVESEKKEAKKEETKVKKRNSSRILDAVRSKPLTLPLPLPFPLPPPPPQFSFISSIPMAPPIEKNLIKGLSSNVNTSVFIFCLHNLYI